jgi:hypothetical protein
MSNFEIFFLLFGFFFIFFTAAAVEKNMPFSFIFKSNIFAALFYGFVVFVP